MTQGANIYYIWYGNWAISDPAAAPILDNLAMHIGGSPYFNINTTYYNGSGVHVPNSVFFAGETFSLGGRHEGRALLLHRVGEGLELLAHIVARRQTLGSGARLIARICDLRHEKGQHFDHTVELP